MSEGSRWQEAINHHFDYYRATVSETANTVINQMITDLEPAFGHLQDVDMGKVRHYENQVGFVDGFGNTRFRVLFSSGETCNVVGTGRSAEPVANAIRRFAHSPSRCDVAVDATAPGLFGRVRRHAKRFATERGIAHREISNLDADNGDTIYLGSRTSQMMLRIYEKGLLEAKHIGERGTAIPEASRNAVRFELEFKPQSKVAREFAAKARPSQFWGASDWSKRYALAMLRFDAEKYITRERKESDQERALRYMGLQYRNHLLAKLEEFGGDTCALGDFIAGLVRPAEETLE